MLEEEQDGHTEDHRRQYFKKESTVEPMASYLYMQIHKIWVNKQEELEILIRGGKSDLTDNC